LFNNGVKKLESALISKSKGPFSAQQNETKFRLQKQEFSYFTVKTKVSV